MAMFNLLDGSATREQIIDAINRILKRDAGVTDFGTRILWTDFTGKGLNRQTGAIEDNDQPTLTIENGDGEHLLITKSTDSSTVFEVQDEGVTFTILNPAAGALTIGGDVTIQGSLTVDSNTVLGNSNTDTTTVRGVLKFTYTTTTGFVTFQATNSATPDLEIKRNDGTQLWRALNAGGMIIGTASTMSGSELLRVQGQARIEGATTITTGDLVVSSGNVDVAGGTGGTLRVAFVFVNATGADGSEQFLVNGTSRLKGLVTITTGGASITGATTFVSGGVTITAGGLIVTAGGATITAGGLTVSASGATITGNSSVAGTFTVTTSGNQRFLVTSGGNVALGKSAPATTDTDGFPYMPSVNGAPSGTATSITGFVPWAWNQATNQIYVHIGGGAWVKTAALT